MKNHVLDGVEFLSTLNDESIAKDSQDVRSVVRHGRQGFDIDLVGVPAGVERFVFEILSHVVRSSLIFHSVFFDKHPQVDITPTAGVAVCDAPVEDDSNDPFEPMSQFINSVSNRFLEFSLWDLQKRIVRAREAVLVDLDHSPVPVSAFDDEVVRRQDVDGFRYTGL